MILAADIGATKTRLGLFAGRGSSPEVSDTFATAGFARPFDMIQTFLESTGVRPGRASLAVAAPIVGRVARSVKLPWSLDADELQRELRVADLILVNDVEANARGIDGLGAHDFALVTEGAGDVAGPRAVVSAGTGLGEAALWWDGTRHRPAASEGGSASFAPSSELEVDLYRFLAAERGRVSVGHILSGPGLQNLYRFVSGEREAPDPAAISAAAQADRSSVASTAVDLFVSIYGARAGDVALAYAATGGVYLGGGIAPKLLPRFLEGAFMDAFVAKGSLAAFLRRIPVRVVLNADAALIGAALFAQDAGPDTLALAA